MQLPVTPGADRAHLYSTTIAAPPQGTEGPDVIEGTEGYDVIEGRGGNDRLSGRGGADFMNGGAGDDWIDGGDGDDTLIDSSGVNTILGGNGDDLILAKNTTSTAWTIDGGAGRDTIDVGFTGTGTVAPLSVTGGAGRDAFTINWSAGRQLLAIEDFATGIDGDMLDLSPLLPTDNYDNPFGASSPVGARFVQRGLDTVLQVSGARWGESGSFDLVVLKNVVREQLGFSNIGYGFDPTGSAAPRALDGTNGNDERFGSSSNDTMTGAGGADRLFGGLGDDRINGGAGNDVLDGDAIYQWRTQFRDPYAYFPSGHDELDGGDGNDQLNSSWGNDILRGGAGDDELTLSNSSLLQENHQVRLHGDAGSDHLILSNRLNVRLNVSMEGGTGSDVFTIGKIVSQGSVTITDFAAGQGGDVLDLFSVRPWTGANPFADGTYRLVQRGADAVVQVDPVNRYDIVTLKNVDVAKLTYANFMGGHAPDGSSSGALFVGTGADDGYTGTALGDTILGAGGNDTLAGGGGNDILSGGQGNDRIDGGAGRDTVRLETALSNYRVTRSGADVEVVGLGAAAVEGADMMTGVERLTFGNTGLALDTDGAAGQVYRLYRAAFDRVPDAPGVGFWLGNMDKGTSLDAVARAFAGTDEFIKLNVSVSSYNGIVTNLYRNVLDREPDAAGLSFWRSALEEQRTSVADVLLAFSESAENREAVATLIANGVYYEF